MRVKIFVINIRHFIFNAGFPNNIMFYLYGLIVSYLCTMSDNKN
jgi:hypothetical protein